MTASEIQKKTWYGPINKNGGVQCDREENCKQNTPIYETSEKTIFMA